MPKSTRKLDALAALLERTGGDPTRIEAVRRAQNFRRSWLDLAEVIAQIRARSLYEKWGYSDFYAYCQDELTLKRATVDKLTISYNTLERHAPRVLERDGVANTIPSYESLDYYHRTVGELEAEAEAQVEADDDDEGDGEASAPARRRGRVPQAPTPELREAFEQAVFDEGQPITELRKRFDPHFFPKPKGAEELERIKKASATARKLAELVVEISDLPDNQVRKLEAELGKLRARLDELAEPLREKVTRATARANKRALRARAEFAEQLVQEREPAPRAKAPRAKAPRKRRAAAGG